ncbi:hypothetical protein BOX15_Mlig005964g1 [Macrostomum lignano]|uniref:LYR motif-containing protein 2 n=2 Tax=Macrostomum lignano TaxID=282301 RepID=A0A1I8I8X9_9PLAT|nr:hypothetical protein BOX15_Mlig011827g1 [Macrostomum lignano]PAA94337.1 hypothetical protein BOX15_Mlig005964g1 [Macrostomum lignano]
MSNSLKHFILKAETRQLYRSLLRTAGKVADSNQRRELRQWIRAEFELHRADTDLDSIKAALANGKQAKSKLEQMISSST